MTKYEKRDFRLGDYWLSQRPGSSAWQRTWFDNDSKQTRKASLGTVDYDEAVKRLEEFYFAERFKTQQDLPADTVGLKLVLDDYLENHAIKLRSYKTHIILFRYWLEFYKDGSVDDVRDFRRQEEFRDFLFAKGLAVNSVNRVLEAGRAAVRRAYKRNTISVNPFIQVLPYERDKPMGRPLSVEEIGKLYAQCADHMRLFMILMLGTGARNEALCHLEWPQIDFDEGLIHLNPAGRKQTSKRRPTVRLVPFVREQLLPMRKDEGRVLMFRGKSMNTAYQGIEKAVGRAKFGKKGEDISPYSFRHTVARWLRKEGVSPWETAMQLGHKMPGFDMTERYTSWSPDYLVKAAEALDKLLRVSIPLDAPLIERGR